jgi:PAS domain S-box-containing protein
MLAESVKPSYEELKQRVQQLEAELVELRDAEASYRREKSTIRKVEEMALLGHWQLDLVSNTLYWSDEIYRIFDISARDFEANYEAFLNTVHPHDREYVDRAYTESLRNKTGYDIVHRLLLRDGRIKYVHEKCQTEYGEDGKPVRSLGTVQDVTDRVRAQQTFSGIIGGDPKMRELFDAIRDLSNINVPIYVQGESGTGKELVANAIHNRGPRAHEPFVPINCSALPEGLLESELFGHVKGAFTGAIRDKRGRFELADGGTLFLDEVADLPKSVQVKLLRVLQEGKLERVGDEKTISVDVRIISAANRDLRTEVDKGNFRADLFYRIRVVPLLIPPLRERRSDIPLLVDHFIERMAQEGQHSEGISKEVLPVLLDYPWPGNIRELQSALRYALIKSRGELIRPEHLPEELKTLQHGSTAVESVQYQQPLSPEGLQEDSKEIRAEKPGRVKLDRISVIEALKEAGGNKTSAANILRIGRATLYRYLNDNPL